MAKKKREYTYIAEAGILIGDQIEIKATSIDMARIKARKMFEKEHPDAENIEVSYIARK